MKIQSLSHHDITFEFTDGKYVMSHVTQESLPVRLIAVTTADGTRGTGEVVRKPDIDFAEAEARELAVLDELSGRSMADLPGMAARLRREGKLLRGLAFALETAYLDWVGRRTDQPLHALLGGCKSDTLPNYYSVSAGSPEAVLRDVRTRGAEAPVLQIKLGIGDLTSDIALTRAVFDSLSEDQILLADFNGALSLDQARTALSSFNHPRLYWEEPCYSFDDNLAATKATGARVMFDQCIDSPARVAQVCTNGIAAAVAIKPAFLGGLMATAAARDQCVDAGIKLRVDGPWCGHVAAAAAVHLAGGTDPEMLIASCDLRQPLDLREDWGGIHHLPRGRIAPSDGPGHGVAVPEYTH